MIWCKCMCRLLMYVFKNRSTFWNKVIDSFYLASTNDTILWEIAGKKTHSHGWGYVVYRFRKDKASISYYRTPMSISNDFEGIDTLKSLGKSEYDVQILIAHSRLTGVKEVKNIENTHPYMEHVTGKFTLWLAHNGRVNKPGIAREVRLEDYVKAYSDTYFLTKYLASKISPVVNGYRIANVLNEIISKGYVVSALNIVALLMVSDEKVYGFALNYVAPRASEREKYYKLYFSSLSTNEKLIASSTFTKYFKEKEFTALDNGDLIFFEITNGALKSYLINIFEVR